MDVVQDPAQTRTEQSRPAGDGPLCVLVITRGTAAAHALPERGELHIGRDASCEIHITDPSISRRHAVLRVGAGMQVEDLGSVNGTVVRRSQWDSRAAPIASTPGRPVELFEGDSIALGSALLVLSRNRPTDPCEGRRPTGPGARYTCDATRLDELLGRIAVGSINVVLWGESGVGKDFLARQIHERSPRAAGTLVRFDCAATEAQMAERELFGVESGVGGAELGLLEAAHGGTLLLDAAHEMPLGLQAKVLRVIEGRTLLRVGGQRPRGVDVRFIAASPCDLEAAVDRGAFRHDLYYRLAGISVRVPPLRERPEEVEPLARAFTAQACAALGRPAPVLAEETAAALRRHRWPGNVRELRNAIERAVLLCDGPTLLPTHLALRRDRAPERSAAATAATLRACSADEAPGADATGAAPVALRASVEAVEREQILAALARSNGNQTRAATLLGISRRALITRLEQYGLPRPRKPRRT